MNVFRLGRSFLILLLLPAAGVCQNLQLADSLNGRGMEFYEGGQYRQAEFYLREAFRIYEESDDPSQWLVPGIDYAEILVDRARYDQALKLFNRLLQAAEERQNVAAQARIQNDLGWAYNIIDQNEKALAHLKKAIPLAEQARDTLRLGYIYNNIGGIYKDRGNYQTSIEYRQKSLIYKRKAGSRKSVAITLSNLGSTYRRLSLYDKAFEYYRQSLSIYSEIKNIALQASVYQDLADVYKDLGQYDQALKYYQQSLEYRKKAGNPKNTAITINNLGTLYSELGQHERALEYYRRTLEIEEPFSGPASRAVSLKNVGNGLWQTGHRKEATGYYRKALALRRQAGNPRKTPLSLMDLAKVELNRGDFTRARDYVQQARLLADSTGDRSLLRSTAMLFGDIAESQGNTSDALEHYRMELKYSRMLDDNSRQWALKRLARALNTAGSDSALHYGQQAIGLIEEGRLQAGRLLQYKAGYFKQHVDFYIDVASWQLKYRDNVAEAYRLAELAKARVLSDELTRAARRIDESLPEKVRLERAQYLADISRLYSHLRRIPAGTETETIKEQLREKELAYAAFENSLQEKYAGYKSLKSPEPVSLRQVQQMQDSETAVLEYALSGRHLLTFYISRNEVEAYHMNLRQRDSSETRPALDDRVADFREAIFSGAREDSIRTLSRPLYNQLIAPFRKKLASKENLVIVPDGYLAYLPFEALSKDNDYLVSQFNIKYAPSMTGFSLIPAPADYSRGNILTIANTDRYASDEGAPVLPTADLEVESISEFFNNATILRNRDINEGNVKARLQDNYSIVHIAAHSVIDEQNSSLSGIILGKSESETGIGNDGYLRNAEIYRLNISSNMVVLSACKSGIGRMIAGEGILGLQRAFFNAGTSTVVVSLWDVYDRSTTHFMQLFYRALTRGPTDRTWGDTWQSLLRWTGWDQSIRFGNTAASMRKAKLAMLDHPKYHHPVYWAPFIVVGR